MNNPKWYIRKQKFDIQFCCEPCEDFRLVNGQKPFGTQLSEKGVRTLNIECCKCELKPADYDAVRKDLQIA